MPELSRLTASCPECGKDSVLVADRVPAGTKLACSHCGAPLGYWNQFVGSGDPDPAQRRTGW